MSEQSNEDQGTDKLLLPKDNKEMKAEIDAKSTQSELVKKESEEPVMTKQKEEKQVSIRIVRAIIIFFICIITIILIQPKYLGS